VILASSSPRRRILLRSVWPDFAVFSPDIDEAQRDGEAPLAYVQRMAAEKAFAGGLARLLSGQLDITQTDDIVIAADTIVIAPDGSHILGKPRTPQEAADTLRTLRGVTHTVCTAVYVEAFERRMSGRVNTANQAELVQTRVTMRHYTDDEMHAYIASDDWRDKAGGYAIQHEGFHPVAHIDGCYTNVVGLPVCAVKRCLDGLGFTLGADLVIPHPEDCDCPPVLPR
jgi:MAF protein